MYICKDCGWSSENRHSYCAHRRIHNTNYISGFNIASKKSDPPICEYCDTKFKSWNSVISHYHICYKYNIHKYGLNGIINNSKYLFKFYNINELDEYRYNFISNYMDPLFPTIHSIKNLFKNIDSNKYSILISLFKFNSIKNLFIKLYNKYTIPEIANSLMVADSVLCRVYRINNINKIWFKSSKLHLQCKQIIVDTLNCDTITEYRVGKYWIDEYCPKLNLAIEFDGEWCHDKNRDLQRESEIKSLINGVKFIRIPIVKYIGVDKNLLKSELLKHKAI